MVAAKRIPVDLQFLKQFTKYGNFERVRVAAWSAMLRVASDSRDMWHALCEFVATDTTNIRRKVLSEALLYVPGKESETMLQTDEKFMDALWEAMKCVAGSRTRSPNAHTADTKGVAFKQPHETSAFLC